MPCSGHLVWWRAHRQCPMHIIYSHAQPYHLTQAALICLGKYHSRKADTVIIGRDANVSTLLTSGSSGFRPFWFASTICTSRAPVDYCKPSVRLHLGTAHMREHLPEPTLQPQGDHHQQ